MIRSSSGTNSTAATTTSGESSAIASLPLNCGYGTRPDADVVAPASIRPIIIDPESPMKILAGWKLYGRKPRHAPASVAAISAGG